MNKVFLGSDVLKNKKVMESVIGSGIITLNRVIKAGLFVNMNNWIELEKGGSSLAKNYGKSVVPSEKINHALIKGISLVC